MNDLIQWPCAQYWDKPWNPIIGCRKCSPACERCYAESMMRRFGAADFSPHTTGKSKPPRKGVVFCGNMTDLFGEWVPLKVIFGMLSCMWHHPNPHDGPVPLPATYLWLTKRVDRMCEALSNYTTCPNAYFGFTAENQEWYDKRLSKWIKTWTNPLERRNWWLSCEPLLGPVDLHFYTYWNIPKWLVVGCESGPKRRPCKIEWVESIVKQCLATKVPVFVKQLDIGGKCVTDINKFPEYLRIRQVPWATKGGEK